MRNKKYKQELLHKANPSHKKNPHAKPSYKKGGEYFAPFTNKIAIKNGKMDAQDVITMLDDICFNATVNTMYLYQENDELKYAQQERNYGKADGICWVMEDLENVIDKIKDAINRESGNKKKKK